MRALIAPDKFKGSLTGPEAANAIARGISAARPDIQTVLLPMADGGEGTVAAVLAAGGWKPVDVAVRGPFGTSVRATFALRGTTAICEMATASGLGLIAAGDSGGALYGSSYGTGQLIGAALDRGATRIVLGIGGTGTNDAGAGALRALGARLRDDRNTEIAPGGAALASLARLDVSDLDRRLQSCSIEFATDVDNVLLGPRGATAVFGPQKGARADEIAALDAALARFANAVAHAGGRDTRLTAGSGAGGGIAFGLCAFSQARTRPGFALLSEIVGFEVALAGASWCLTGEGSIDEQTLSGKVVDAVAAMAQTYGVPTYAFGGRVDPEAARALAVRGCESIAIADPGVAETIAMRDASANLERAAERTAATFAGEQS